MHARPMNTAHDSDAFDPSRHLISDRALTRLAERMEAAEAALRAPAPTPGDALAEEAARLRAEADAYLAWRGHQVPAGWRRRETHAGTAWRRGALQVVARLAPRGLSELHTLSVEITRREGTAVTLADLLVATEAFVDAGSVVGVDPIDHGWPELRARWAVSLPSAERRAA